MLVFELSMPRNNSWNGKWSGEEKKYIRTRSLRHLSICKKIVDNSPYIYSFGDGWVASVTVRETTSEQARKLIKQSDGFCGYDWMIDEIIKDGKISGKKTI